MECTTEMRNKYLKIDIVLELKDEMAEFGSKKLDNVENRSKVICKTIGFASQRELVSPKGTQHEFHSFETPEEAEGFQIE